MHPRASHLQQRAEPASWGPSPPRSEQEEQPCPAPCHQASFLPPRPSSRESRVGTSKLPLLAAAWLWGAESAPARPTPSTSTWPALLLGRPRLATSQSQGVRPGCQPRCCSRCPSLHQPGLGSSHTHSGPDAQSPLNWFRRGSCVQSQVAKGAWVLPTLPEGVESWTLPVLQGRGPAEGQGGSLGHWIWLGLEGKMEPLQKKKYH